MTPGCRGCIAVNRGSQAVNHLEDCRKRVIEELEKVGDERVIRQKERWEEGLTEALQEEEGTLMREPSKEEEDQMEEELYGNHEEEEMREEVVNNEENDVVMWLSMPAKKQEDGTMGSVT